MRLLCLWCFFSAPHRTRHPMMQVEKLHSTCSFLPACCFSGMAPPYLFSGVQVVARNLQVCQKISDFQSNGDASTKHPSKQLSGPQPLLWSHPLLRKCVLATLPPRGLQTSEEPSFAFNKHLLNIATNQPICLTKTCAVKLGRELFLRTPYFAEQVLRCLRQARMEDSQVLEPQIIEAKRPTCFAKNQSTGATARFMHRQQMPPLQPPMRSSVLNGEHHFPQMTASALPFACCSVKVVK